jgi:hypothetical protein
LQCRKQTSLAKLIKILAASVGGGLVVGAGIRLAEAIAARHPSVRADESRKLSERLDVLEDRLLGLEGKDRSAIQSHLNGEVIRLRGELRDWLEESVAAHMTEVELRLKTDSELGRKQMLDAIAETVQTRVIHRISRLEDEVAGQSAAMSELRECSLRTEQSVQKLLGGLDRLILKHTPAAEEAIEPSLADRGGIPAPEITPSGSASLPGMGAAPAVEPEPPAFVPSVKSHRWKIFG